MGGAKVTICISGFWPGVGDHSSSYLTPYSEPGAVLTFGILKWFAYSEFLPMHAQPLTIGEDVARGFCLTRSDLDGQRDSCQCSNGGIGGL